MYEPKEAKRIYQRHNQLPTPDEVNTEMNRAKYFTRLDASSGFWAIQLDDLSSKISTCATPSGRYRFFGLPCGIKSAPEVFQRLIHANIAAFDLFVVVVTYYYTAVTVSSKD
ncbi:polyprotein [Elysia marginata]|uniref:Polyprotein n=1 Tax=Elysia marginata TaxID=1093978 RepID=A0AAV4F313_9GAST|nr:polyprotein [Elysia marginata]